jgi:hypothetical protein
VVVGEQTAFPGSKAIGLQDIERSKSMTILVVESVGQDVHWMEPIDLPFDSMSFAVNDKTKPSVSSKHRHHPNVCMVDGSTRWLSNNITPEMLKAMLTINNTTR